MQGVGKGALDSAIQERGLDPGHVDAQQLIDAEPLLCGRLRGDRFGLALLASCSTIKTTCSPLFAHGARVAGVAASFRHTTAVQPLCWPSAGPLLALC